MTNEEFEQEVQLYQQVLLKAFTQVKPNIGIGFEDVIPDIIARFQALYEQDRSRFYQLCAALLTQKQREIRVGILELISALKKRDTTLAVVLARLALKDKSITEEALHALWSMKILRVLPQVFELAEQGYSSALYMLRRMVRTSEEIARGIPIARQYITAEEYDLREAALFFLQKYSIMEYEWERVLAAVYLYEDELFIDALKKAPPEHVLEPLCQLRDKMPKFSAQHEDLSSTIEVLEQKQAEVHEQGERKEN